MKLGGNMQNIIGKLMIVGNTQLVSKYILNQEKHHVKTDFKNEYRSFLNKYGVSYNEEYLWD